jgi:hypothetical protein
MIRPVTCLCLLAAFGSGLYLYSEKHRTALLDRDIGRVIHATEAARARTGMLRAEWALLNEPGRLNDMSGRYLTLHPMAPTQFVQIGDLALHLPAPVAQPATGGTDEEDAPATPALASETAVDAAISAPSGLPSHHPMQPPLHADAAPLAKPTAKQFAKLEARHSAHHVALADRQDSSSQHDGLPRGTPLPLAAPQPLGARVYRALARPMHAVAPQRVVAAVPSFAPAVSSALGAGAGGDGRVPPPVPYGR